MTVSEHDRGEQLRLVGRDPTACTCCTTASTPPTSRRRPRRCRWRERCGLRPGTPVVGAVGACTEQKGHGHLIEASARLRGRATSMPQVLLVGAGPLEPVLRLGSLAAWTSPTSWRSPGTQADPGRHMALMDVGALPSIDEGFPLTSVGDDGMGLADGGVRPRRDPRGDHRRRHQPGGAHRRRGGPDRRPRRAPAGRARRGGRWVDGPGNTCGRTSSCSSTSPPRRRSTNPARRRPTRGFGSQVKRIVAGA